MRTLLNTIGGLLLAAFLFGCDMDGPGEDAGEAFDDTVENVEEAGDEAADEFDEATDDMEEETEEIVPE